MTCSPPTSFYHAGKCKAHCRATSFLASDHRCVTLLMAFMSVSACSIAHVLLQQTSVRSKLATLHCQTVPTSGLVTDVSWLWQPDRIIDGTECFYISQRMLDNPRIQITTYILNNSALPNGPDIRSSFVTNVS